MRASPIKILSTRAIDAAYVQLAAKHGIAIEQQPFIDIIPISDSITNGHIAALAQQKLLAIFTSANAVTAVFNQLNNNVPQWQIAGINGRTEAAIKMHLPASTIICRGNNSEDLANKILEQNSPLPATFFCGDKRLNTLPEMLSANGVSLQEIVVYKTVSAPVKIATKYDGIIFYSPSAADAYFELNDWSDDTAIFAIGNTTAQHLKKYTHQQIHCSADASQQSITELIISYYATK